MRSAAVVLRGFVDLPLFAQGQHYVFYLSCTTGGGGSVSLITTTADLHRHLIGVCGVMPVDITARIAYDVPLLIWPPACLTSIITPDSTTIQSLPYFTNGMRCKVSALRTAGSIISGGPNPGPRSGNAPDRRTDQDTHPPEVGELLKAGQIEPGTRVRYGASSASPGPSSAPEPCALCAALRDKYDRLEATDDAKRKEICCSLEAQRLHASLSLCRPGQVKRSAPEPSALDDTSSDSNSNDAYPCPLPHDVTMTLYADDLAISVATPTHTHHLTIATAALYPPAPPTPPTLPAVPSLRLRGSGTRKGKRPAATPTRGTFDALSADEDEGALGEPPSAAEPTPTDAGASSSHPPPAHPPLTAVAAAAPSPAPAPSSSHVPDLVTHFDALASTHGATASTTTPPPAAPALADLRAITDEHGATLLDLGTDLRILSGEFFRLRGDTEHFGSDLHLLSDEFRQFSSAQRISDQSHQEAAARLALQMESHARAQEDRHDASRDELRSTLKVFDTAARTSLDEMKALITTVMTSTLDRHVPITDEPPALDPSAGQPPTTAGAGADRFNLPPFGRGRPLHASRAPPRLRHPEAAGPSHHNSPAARFDTAEPHRPSHDSAPRRPRDVSHQHTFGDSPPHAHDKRHAGYCRAVDVDRVEGAKLYAVLAVVDIDDIATAFVSEQFRIWTLSRPQTTSITIETAVWSLFRINRRDAFTALADYDMHFEDFTARLQHGENTDDSLDGILRITLPHAMGLDANRTIPVVIETLEFCGINDSVRDIITSHALSCAAVKAASQAHLAPIPSPTRTRERNVIRSTLLHALMHLPYSEDSTNALPSDHGPDVTSSPYESSRRTLWNRLPQLDVAGALPSWAPNHSIQDFQQLLLTTLHTDTASLIADLLRETDPLQTILAAVLRRHHDSAEFTTIVSADVAEHLKSELEHYKQLNAHSVLEAQRNPADPRLQRSFLSVLCVCLAAIRSAFLGTSRDGALHSEARQFLTQLSTMQHTSDVDYLLKANSYWLRYSKLWGPNLLLSLCEGGQIQTLLPSVTARLTPAMQERILLFFGDIAHRLRSAHRDGTLPQAFALQLSSILGKPLLLHSTIPSLSTYAEFSNQVEGLADLHRSEMNRGIHTHRIAHPADLAFVGKTGALADWWPAMIQQVLGHHNRRLVAPHEQIALVAWDDIQAVHHDDEVLQVSDAPRFRPGTRTIERQHDRLATAADNQFTKLEANVHKVQTQIETKVGSLKDSLESTLEAKVGSLQVNIQKHLDTIQSTIAKVSKDLGSRLDKNDASMAAFHEMNAHNAQTMQHCLANVAASTTDLKHAATIKDTAAAIGRHTRAHPVNLPPISGSSVPRPPPVFELAVAPEDTADAMSHLFCIASATHDVSTIDDLLAWMDTDDLQDESELFALTYNRRPPPPAPGALKLMKWPALRFDDLTEKAKELYRRRDKVTSADAYNATTNRPCTNCPPESRLMPHLENRCPTIYRHTGQGQRDRDAVRLARDAERLQELQPGSEGK